MESHVYHNNSKIAVIKLQLRNVFPSHCSKIQSMNFCSHHPSGITVEMVGIESGTNGRSCYQHDICGSLVEEDVVLRLRKIQIRNSFGQEETAIAAFHVTDGIDHDLVILCLTLHHLMVFWCR